MVKGTRLLRGEEANQYTFVCNRLSDTMRDMGFSQLILPSLWDTETFIQKGGPEIVRTMYNFKDKGDRDICLVPECTAIIQQKWNDGWKHEEKKPYKVFYIQRCYRYDRPQAGRYREFTQCGVEILGGKAPDDVALAHESLTRCLKVFNIDFKFVPSVKRGLSYYVEDGFEAEVESLGSQKQIAGGGRYAEGIGWAIGVDRLMLSIRP